MNKTAWNDSILEFSQRNFGKSSKVREIISSDERMVFSFAVTMGAKDARRSGLTFDADSIARALRGDYDNLVSLLSIDPTAHSFTIGIRRLSPETLDRMRTKINQNTQKTRILEKRSLRTEVLMFSAALAALIACSVATHNYWYAYEEPWHGVVEFLVYHIPKSLLPSTLK